MLTKKNVSLMLISVSFVLNTLLAAPQPNYDASLERSPVTNRELPRQVAIQTHRDARKNIAGYPSFEDEQLGVTTFLWAKSNHQATSPVLPDWPITARRKERRQLIERKTRNFLAHNGTRLGLSKRAIVTARLHELHDPKRGPIIARYQQTHQGLEVFGRRLNVILDRKLQPVAASGYFSVDNSANERRVASLTARDEFRQNLPQAIAIAVVDLGGQLNPAALESIGKQGDYTRFRVTQNSGPYSLTGTPRGKRVYFPIDDRLVPAWYLEVALKHHNTAEYLSYGYVVAAEDGRILFRNNHIARDVFSYRVFADVFLPFDLPFGNEHIPLTVLDPKLDPPRTVTAMNLVTLQSGPISTGDPWLPIGATETVGNNVDAYVDLVDFNGLQTRLGDFRAQVTSSSVFDYSLAADADPTTFTARSAGIVNLFYLNNFLHDWWYDNGFNEAAGNAQSNNYNRGGLGGDPILAEAQDYSGYDNANMDTPADGESPRMQMYLWKDLISNPASLSASGLGSLTVNTSSFGAAQFDLKGEITTVTPRDGCANLTNDIGGKVALVDRGDCLFVTKALNAQRAGASGVIIANNVDDGTAPGMAGSDPSITIPVLSTSFVDGIRIKNALLHGPVTVSMYYKRKVDIDGALDNTIVAHEWFHHVTSRLVGDGNGLINRQGLALSEGWSDFCALMLLTRPEDATLVGNAGFSGAYPLATYVEPSAYFGIRRAPYSTNPSIFPMTFKHIADKEALPTTAPLAPVGGKNSEEHNAGEIWANTLWDFYVSLLNDPRHTFLQAQERMKDYLIAGLKLTPIEPNFLEARDALLAAVKATDQYDFELAARSFAKYGMGIDAVAPSRTSRNNNELEESFVALAGAYEVTRANLDTSQIRGCSDADKVLDVGETAYLRLTIHDTGTSLLPKAIKARVTSDAEVVLGNQGYLRFSAFNAKGFAHAHIPVTLKSAALADILKLNVTFLEVGDTSDAVREPQPIWVEKQVNYDLKKSFTVDNVERTAATMVDWSRTFKAVSGVGEGWQVTQDFDTRYHTGQVWFIPDNDTVTTATLTSPPIVVGQSSFQVVFDTLFQFETAWDQGRDFSYDGGVVEIKIDGGKWQDVLAAGGRFTQGGYNSQVIAFAPDQEPSHARQGFGRSSNGITQHTIDFGMMLAGSKVRLRFRAASDEAVGDLGWLLDNIRVFGTTNLPFSEFIPSPDTCVKN